LSPERPDGDIDAGHLADQPRVRARGVHHDRGVHGARARVHADHAVARSQQAGHRPLLMKPDAAAPGRGGIAIVTS